MSANRCATLSGILRRTRDVPFAAAGLTLLTRVSLRADEAFVRGDLNNAAGLSSAFA